MWRRHREENSKTPRMENKRKKILPSFSGMTKPTMVKLGNSFKCSLCKKTGDYPALVPHIQTHARNVMSYRGVQIYRCGLDCAQAPHHHCCFCNKTIINKHCFLRHLKTCDEGNLSPQRSFSCSTPQITAVFHTIPGTTMLQAVTTSSTKATTSIEPGKSQGPATTPFILQAVPSLSLQTSVAPSSSSSSAALPSQAAAAKQSSTDASSSAKQASESSDASSLAKRVSTDSASPEKESSDKPEADGSSSHPQQQSPSSSESQAAAFIPPLSPLLSTPTKTIPSSSSSSSSSQPQPTTVRVSVSQQPPTAMSPEHEELEESVLSISDTLHLPTSSTPSPPPIDSLVPLFASEECSSPAPAANAVSSSSYREKSRERVKCPHCPTQLIRRNLKVHINRHHKDILVEARVKSQFRSLYVDAKNGILAVQRHTHGFLAPVHVQKGSHGGGSRAGADMQGEGEGQLQPQGPRCDLRACQQFQQMSLKINILH
ncbi:uncharacterized protein LOC134467078 [Engraulis encrasicolus]|uniref:uncharacterized protein LOC134467078 n=1 Tax=Engraulis encrasicolus TaxID=184585 RepID=UPI002FD1C685